MIQVSIDFHRVKITVFLCSYAWVVEKNSSGVKQQNLSWLRMAGRTSDCCFSALFVTLLCVCVLFFFKFSQSQSNLTAVRCVFDRKTMVYFIHWTFTHLYTHTLFRSSDFGTLAWFGCRCVANLWSWPQSAARTLLRSRVMEIELSKPARVQPR